MDATLGARAREARHVHYPYRPAAWPTPLDLVWSLTSRIQAATSLGSRSMPADLNAKRLHLFKETIPRLYPGRGNVESRHAATSTMVEDLKALGPSVSIELSSWPCKQPEQIVPAFADVRRAHAKALYLLADGVSYCSSNGGSQSRGQGSATGRVRGAGTSPTQAD